jgi:hypothetical protein
LWDSLIAAGGPTGSAPSLLRELGIYGGAQGIWVDKKKTGSISPNDAGLAVGLRHDGSSYDDDLFEDGIIYHFPQTNRAGHRDASETTALRNLFELRLPVFVITDSPLNRARRDVHLGWVVDVDDAGAQCLIEFSEEWHAPASVPTTTEFRLEANREERAQKQKRLKRSPKFAFEVGKRCGWRCAVCAIDLKPMLDAAHIRGVDDRGSDDPRNGLILCKNHHAAFDAGLINFHPETGTVAVSADITADQLGITTIVLEHSIRPHIDALRWRWDNPVRPKDSKKVSFRLLSPAGSRNAAA